jgi:HAD superfamily hydrolase (TIGR01484 family)
VARKLVSYAKQSDIYLEVYVGDQYFVERDSEHSRIHLSVMRVPPIIAPLAELVEHEVVTKMESLTLNDDEHAHINAMGAQFADEIVIGWATAPGSSADFANIIRRGISKGVGVQTLAEHLSIPLSQVMGVGDGLNDEPLIRAAGLGVAMGDAPDSVKQIAQWVTATVAEEGLALAVERFILSNGHH